MELTWDVIDAHVLDFTENGGINPVVVVHPNTIIPIESGETKRLIVLDETVEDNTIYVLDFYDYQKSQRLKLSKDSINDATSTDNEQDKTLLKYNKKIRKQMRVSRTSAVKTYYQKWLYILKLEEENKVLSLVDKWIYANGEEADRLENEIATNTKGV